MWKKKRTIKELETKSTRDRREPKRWYKQNWKEKIKNELLELEMESNKKRKRGAF
jgi:hypothetical protein